MAQKNRTTSTVARHTEAIVTPTAGAFLGLALGVLKSAGRVAQIINDEVGKPLVAQGIIGVAKVMEEGKKFSAKLPQEEKVETAPVSDALARLKAVKTTVVEDAKVVDIEFTEEA